MRVYLLSYQHAFHAGNHADVLKHLTLLAVLEKLTTKSKPMFYLDTHAGAGLYDVGGQKALKNSEFESGILRLVENLEQQLSKENDEDAATPSFVNVYIDNVKQALDNQCYLGSPRIASLMLREFDNAHAVELSVEAENALGRALHNLAISSHCRDGFEALRAYMPAKPNRGMVLIDPPYEQASEYAGVVDAVRSALIKWPNGCFMVWYPLLSPTRIDRKTNQEVENKKAGLSEHMVETIAKLPVKSALSIDLCPTVANVNTGMYGSGVCIVNPPWQLEQSLQQIVVLLTKTLVLDNNTLSGCKWLKQEA